MGPEEHFTSAPSAPSPMRASALGEKTTDADPARNHSGGAEERDTGCIWRQSPLDVAFNQAGSTQQSTTENTKTSPFCPHGRLQAALLRLSDALYCFSVSYCSKITPIS